MFCLCIGLLALPSMVEAYAYAYRRLVLKKDGKIVKVVDLVSDAHSPEKSGKLAQGPIDKALYTTLKKMALNKDREPFEIFGESSAALISCLSESCFLMQGGMWLNLHKLHAMLNQENSKPEKTDSFLRRLLQYIGILKVQQRKSVYTHADNHRYHGASFEDKANLISETKDFVVRKNLVEQSILHYKNKLDAQSYEIVDKLWRNFKHSLACYLASGRLRCFRDDKIIKAYERHFSRSGSAILCRAMDFEVLLKILNSEYKHNIVLAGGAHCYQLAQWLIDEFGFNLTQSCGFQDCLLVTLPQILPRSFLNILESDPFEQNSAEA